MVAARHELGRRIYNFRCYYCHGYSGDAKTLASSFLTPPPRNFQGTTPGSMSRERMLVAVRKGLPGTAMQSFSNVLSVDEEESVVDFIRTEFMEQQAENTRYHTTENGWPEHQRYQAAYPFARGTLALDSPDSELNEEQLRGKQLFLSSCISCHDRARVNDEGEPWGKRAVSYPRLNYSHRNDNPAPTPDTLSGATPYAVHDIPPRLDALTLLERQGEKLFQGNCAFCHGADGTGKNWIGTFMEPHARDLTNHEFMRTMSRTQLKRTIEEGLPGTSMPAWKSVLTPSQIEAIIAYVHHAFHPLLD
jgi:cytochrome c oxidase cbb3-type subunit 3